MDHGAIVVGGGHNGLICAAYLARAGLDTLVLEARPDRGRLRLAPSMPSAPGSTSATATTRSSARRRSPTSSTSPASASATSTSTRRSRTSPTTAARPGRSSTTSTAPSMPCGSPTPARSTATAATPPPPGRSPSWCSSWPTSRRRPAACSARWPTGGRRGVATLLRWSRHERRRRAAAVLHRRRRRRSGRRGRPGRVGPVAVHARHRPRRADLRHEARRPGGAAGRRVGRRCRTPCSAALEAHGGDGALRRAGSPPSCARASGCVGVELADGTRIEAPIVVSACDPRQTFVGWLRNPPATAARLVVERWRDAATRDGYESKVDAVIERAAPLPPGRHRAARRASATTRSSPTTIVSPHARRRCTPPTGCSAEGAVAERPMFFANVPSVLDPTMAVRRPRRRARVQPRGALHALRARGRMGRPARARALARGLRRAASSPGSSTACGATAP